MAVLGATVLMCTICKELMCCRSTLEGASAMSGTQQWLMPRLNTSKGTEEVMSFPFRLPMILHFASP